MEGVFYLFAYHDIMLSILSKGPFFLGPLPRPGPRSGPFGPVGCWGGPLREKGRWAKSDLEKKCMRSLLWEKLNLRVFIQFPRSRVKSDRGSQRPPPTKWLAIQVFNSLPHITHPASNSPVRREEWRDLVKIGPKVKNEIQKKDWFQDKDRSIKLVAESIVLKPPSGCLFLLCFALSAQYLLFPSG